MRLPAVDIVEGPVAFTIIADVPGATHETTELHLENGVLDVTARAGLSSDGADYKRSFAIPDTADTGAISATVEAGVLTIRIPKAAGAQPRRIAVSTN